MDGYIEHPPLYIYNNNNISRLFTTKELRVRARARINPREQARKSVQTKKRKRLGALVSKVSVLLPIPIAGSR